MASVDDLEAALPFGIVPLGCAVVFGDTISMSVVTLVRSAARLSAKAIAIQSDGKCTTSISGVWAVRELTLHVNGVGTDFENISPALSHFLTNHKRIESDT